MKIESNPVGEASGIEKRKFPAVKQEWFEAWIEGNLRFPQTMDVIQVLIANSFFKEEDGNITDLERSVLSSQQLEEVKKAMNSAHAVRGIPMAATPEGGLPPTDKTRISDERLMEIWENSVESTKEIIGRVAQQLKMRSVMGGGDLISTLDSDKKLRQELGEVFMALAVAVREPEALEMAKEYRELFSRKRQDGKTERIGSPTVVAKKIQFERFVTKRTKDKLPGIAGRLSPNVFRDLS